MVLNVRENVHDNRIYQELFLPQQREFKILTKHFTIITARGVKNPE